jgi:hypothetical protein
MQIRSSTDEDRDALQADCASCVGLCCVALAFARSADFPFDKDAGDPCVNLEDDGYRCTIHPHLRERGYKGCTVFDCFGAGQKVTQETFDGGSWRDSAETRQRMFAVFPLMRQLHELLWYLREAIGMPAAQPIRGELDAVCAETERLTERLTERDPDGILAIHVDAHRDRVNVALTRASELARAGVAASALPRKVRRGADLIGAALSGLDLRGANLRGAYLIAADLRGSDLGFADLIGADLRDAELGGADVSRSLFLTQPQLNSAKGDADTLLPPSLKRPGHWVGP